MASPSKLALILHLLVDEVLLLLISFLISLQELVDRVVLVVLRIRGHRTTGRSISPDWARTETGRPSWDTRSSSM